MSKPAFVYAVGASGTSFVKIGKATDVESRVSSLQTGCPFDLDLWGQAQTWDQRLALQAEATIHRALEPWETRGEWFALHGPIACAVGLMFASRRVRHWSSRTAHWQDRAWEIAKSGAHFELLGHMEDAAILHSCDRDWWKADRADDQWHLVDREAWERHIVRQRGLESGWSTWAAAEAAE